MDIIKLIHSQINDNVQLLIDTSVVEDAISVVKASHFNDSESVLYFFICSESLECRCEKERV